MYQALKSSFVCRNRGFPVKSSAVRPREIIWTHTDVGTNRTSKAEIKILLEGEDRFTTPKPKKLLGFTLELATIKGDLIFDSYARLGTTRASDNHVGSVPLHISPRVQFVDPIDLVVGDAAENIGEPGVRIDAFEFGCFNVEIK